MHVRNLQEHDDTVFPKVSYLLPFFSPTLEQTKTPHGQNTINNTGSTAQHSTAQVKKRKNPPNVQTWDGCNNFNTSTNHFRYAHSLNKVDRTKKVTEKGN